MKEFFPVLRSSQLFSGISEEELAAMLSCLHGSGKADLSQRTPFCSAPETRRSPSVWCCPATCWSFRRISGEAAGPDLRCRLLPALPARC